MGNESSTSTIRNIFAYNKNKNRWKYGVDDFYKNILEISKLDEKNIKDEDKKLIKLYIEYWIKITNAII